MCKEIFANFICNWKEALSKNLKEDDFQENVILPRVHGNTGRLSITSQWNGEPTKCCFQSIDLALRHDVMP